MPSLADGVLTFDFPADWQAAKLDEWSFYRNQFQRLGSGLRVTCPKCDVELRCLQCQSAMTSGIKAVDFLAVERKESTWLIEVKDYRKQRRTKTIDIADEIALKVRDSLAMLMAANSNANDPAEKKLARAAIGALGIRIVLHLEQPPSHSKLFPRAIDPAKVQQRLKQLLRSIDPHPRVLEMANPGTVGWTVRPVAPSGEK